VKPLLAITDIVAILAAVLGVVATFLGAFAYAVFVNRHVRMTKAKIGSIQIKIGDHFVEIEPEDAGSAETLVDAWLREAKETDSQERRRAH
jgi:hypothetical protein